MPLFFSKDHEWVQIDGSKAVMGITDFAAHQLGDITFVELPKIGKTVKQHEVLCAIESVKAASDIYSPVAGTVESVNKALDADPSLVNSDPMNGGWIAALTVSGPEASQGLMDEAAYKAYLKTLE